MLPTATFVAIAVIGGGSLLLLAYLLLYDKGRQAAARLRELSGSGGPGMEQVTRLTHRTLPKIASPLLPKTEEEQTRLRKRMIHAGLYQPQAIYVFLGAKMLLMIIPVLIGLGVQSFTRVPFPYAVLGGLLGGTLGMVLPGLWLDYRKSNRQTSIRRALPDALDVIVICMDGGLTLAAAIVRVAQELRGAHPLLASEMNIMQREVQMGRSTGEALRQFAERYDLEEARSLASVVVQTERYGASLAKALQVHADTLRLKRQQRAEEQAQKAAVKILFPTILCIFPAIFIVVLAPAVFQILDLFAKMR